jgi:hypothetical protein
MKTKEFYVIYKTGLTQYFYCMNITEAIVRAMNNAFNNCFNPEIESITDELGIVTKNIEIKFFQEFS